VCTTTAAAAAAWAGDCGARAPQPRAGSALALGCRESSCPEAQQLRQQPPGSARAARSTSPDSCTRFAAAALPRCCCLNRQPTHTHLLQVLLCGLWQRDEPQVQVLRARRRRRGEARGRLRLWCPGAAACTQQQQQQQQQWACCCRVRAHTQCTAGGQWGWARGVELLSPPSSDGRHSHSASTHALTSLATPLLLSCQLTIRLASSAAETREEGGDSLPGDAMLLLPAPCPHRNAKPAENRSSSGRQTDRGGENALRSHVC
jgi:hypothetical protein